MDEYNFDNFRENIKSHIYNRIEKCSKHGDTEHSYCAFTDISICIECLKERRFLIKKEIDII